MLRYKKLKKKKSDNVKSKLNTIKNKLSKANMCWKAEDKRYNLKQKIASCLSKACFNK